MNWKRGIKNYLLAIVILALPIPFTGRVLVFPLTIAIVFVTIIGALAGGVSLFLWLYCGNTTIEPADADRTTSGE